MLRLQLSASFHLDNSDVETANYVDDDSSQINHSLKRVKRGIYTQGFEDWLKNQYNTDGTFNQFNEENNILVAKRNVPSKDIDDEAPKLEYFNTEAGPGDLMYEDPERRVAMSVERDRDKTKLGPPPSGSLTYRPDLAAAPTTNLRLNRNPELHPVPLTRDMYRTGFGFAPGTDFSYDTFPLTSSNFRTDSNMSEEENSEDEGTTPKNQEESNRQSIVDYFQNIHKASQHVPEEHISSNPSMEVVEGLNSSSEVVDLNEAKKPKIENEDYPSNPDYKDQISETTDQFDYEPHYPDIEVPEDLDEGSNSLENTPPSDLSMFGEAEKSSSIAGLGVAQKDQTSATTDQFDYEPHYPDIEVPEDFDERTDSLEDAPSSDLSLLRADETSGAVGLDVSQKVKRDEYTSDFGNLFLTHDTSAGRSDGMTPSNSKHEFKYDEEEFDKKYGASSLISLRGAKAEDGETTTTTDIDNSIIVPNPSLKVQFRTDDSPTSGEVNILESQRSETPEEDIDSNDNLSSNHLVKRNEPTGDFGNLFLSRNSNPVKPAETKPLYPKREFKYDEEEFNQKYGLSSPLELENTAADVSNSESTTDVSNQSSTAQFRSGDSMSSKEAVVNGSSSENQGNSSAQEDSSTNSTTDFKSFLPENNGMLPMIPNGAPSSDTENFYPPGSPSYSGGELPNSAGVPYVTRNTPPRRNMYGQPFQDYDKPFDEFYLTKPQYKSLYPMLLNSGLNFQIFPESISNSLGGPNSYQRPPPNRLGGLGGSYGGFDRPYGNFGGPYGDFGGSFGGFGGLENDTATELDDLENMLDGMDSDIGEASGKLDTSLNLDYEVPPLLEEHRPVVEPPPMTYDENLRIGGPGNTQTATNSLQQPGFLSMNQSDIQESDLNQERPIDFGNEELDLPVPEIPKMELPKVEIPELPKIDSQNGLIEETNEQKEPINTGININAPSPSDTIDILNQLEANAQNEFAPDVRIQTEVNQGTGFQEGTGMAIGNGDRYGSLEDEDSGLQDGIGFAISNGDRYGPSTDQSTSIQDEIGAAIGNGDKYGSPEDQDTGLQDGIGMAISNGDRYGPSTDQDTGLQDGIGMTISNGDRYGPSTDQNTGFNQQKGPNQPQNTGGGDISTSLPPQLQNMGNTFGPNFWNSFSNKMGGISMGMPGMSQLISMTQQAAKKEKQGGGQASQSRPRERPTELMSSQRYPPQGMPPQRYPPKGIPPQGYPLQGIPPQRYPPQTYPTQRYPPQRYPPQRYTLQRYPPQRYLPQRYPPQRYLLQTYPQQRYPLQRYSTYGNIQRQPGRINFPRYPSQRFIVSRYPIRNYNPRNYPGEAYVFPKYRSFIYHPQQRVLHQGYRPGKYYYRKYPPQRYILQRYPYQNYRPTRYYSPKRYVVRRYFPRRYPYQGYRPQRYFRENRYYPRRRGPTYYNPGARFRTLPLNPVRQQSIPVQRVVFQKLYKKPQSFPVRNPANINDKPYTPFCSDCKNVSSMVKKLGELNYVPPQDNLPQGKMITYRSLVSEYSNGNQNGSKALMNSTQKGDLVQNSSSAVLGFRDAQSSADSPSSNEIQEKSRFFDEYNIQSDTKHKLVKRQINRPISLPPQFFPGYGNFPPTRYQYPLLKAATPISYEQRLPYPMFKSPGIISPQGLMGLPGGSLYNPKGMLRNPPTSLSFQRGSTYGKFRSVDPQPEEVPLIEEPLPEEVPLQETPELMEEASSPPPGEEGAAPEDPDFKGRNPYNLNYSKSVSVTKKVTYNSPLEKDQRPYNRKRNNRNDYAAFTRNNNRPMFSYFPNFRKPRNRNNFFEYPEFS